MFRMLQALEREPVEDINQMFDASPATGRMNPNFVNENGEPMPRPAAHSASSFNRVNPHKYLLYKPTFSQLFVFLASGFKELPTNGVILLYLSADGAFGNIKHPEDCKLSDMLEKQKEKIVFFISRT